MAKYVYVALKMHTLGYAGMARCTILTRFVPLALGGSIVNKPSWVCVSSESGKPRTLGWGTRCLVAPYRRHDGWPFHASVISTTFE